VAQDLLKAERGRFFRGNLHCHPKRSDGVVEPEEVAAAYREAGYDFICISVPLAGAEGLQGVCERGGWCPLRTSCRPVRGLGGGPQRETRAYCLARCAECRSVLLYARAPGAMRAAQRGRPSLCGDERSARAIALTGGGDRWMKGTVRTSRSGEAVSQAEFDPE
jgi:hypothetical protein